MKDEYIIINKTDIQKRIEDLENERCGFMFNPNKTAEAISHNEKIELLKQILSQSTPLIPEIEKAYYNGGDMKEKEEFNLYISNLKIKL